MGRSVQQLVRRWSAVAAMGVGLSGVFVAPASAAPDAEQFTAVCDELGEVGLTMGKGQGIWTPAFVVGSNQRLIPYAFDITVGDDELEITVAKSAPKHGRLDVCTFDEGFGGASGTVRVSYTPG